MRVKPSASKLPVIELADPRGKPFLQGPFVPVGEELDIDDIRVEGRLPSELTGSYVRNGPNPQFTPIGSYTSPFDGDGMVHMLTFGNGRVSYRNRWLLTRGLSAERRAGRALYGGMLTPFMPDALSVGPDGDPNPFQNLDNMNVIRPAGRTLALWAGGTPSELTPALS